MSGMKETMRTKKQRWGRRALPTGFAKHNPRDLNYLTTSKSMMDHRNPNHGCQTTSKLSKYSGGSKAIAMQNLQLHLTGTTRSWLSKLPEKSNGSWNKLEK
jgi:hypothetical protein